MSMLKLSSPWVEHYRKVNAMFAQDTDTNVVFDEDEMVIKVYTESAPKAYALTKMLKTELEFGNVALKIEVIPANEKTLGRALGVPTEKLDDMYRLLEETFWGNGCVRGIRKIENVFQYNVYYVMFNNEVVQYFDDNIGDPNGLKSTLMQEIAKDIFVEIPGVFYCTDKPLPIARHTGRYSYGRRYDNCDGAEVEQC